MVPCLTEVMKGQGVQYYMIKFVSDLRQVDGFLGCSGFLLHDITEMFVSDLRQVDGFLGCSGFLLHDITEILLKVALNTIKQTT